MTADDSRKAAYAAVRDGRSRKVLWGKYVGKATDLDHAPARLALVAALDLVGTNGAFDATYEELAALFNTTTRGARIAAHTLAAQHYWTIKPRRGRRGIFTFTIIPQAEREQLFYEAERKWENDYRKWVAAKERWEYDSERWLKAEATHLWLEAESFAKHQFTMPIFSALMNKARAAGVTEAFDLGQHVAEQLWGRRASNGLPDATDYAAQITDTADAEIVAIATRLGYHTAHEESDTSGPENDTSGAIVDTSGARSDTSGAATGTSGARSDTSGAATGTSGVNKSAVNCSDSSLSLSRTVKSAKDSQCAPAAPSGCAGALGEQSPPVHLTIGANQNGAAGCDLCDEDGVARALDGYNLITLTRWPDPHGCETETKLFRCHHSIVENLVALRRALASGEWDASTTGYAEIDGSQENCVSFSAHGIIEGTHSPKSYSPLGAPE